MTRRMTETPPPDDTAPVNKPRRGVTRRGIIAASAVTSVVLAPFVRRAAARSVDPAQAVGPAAAPLNVSGAWGDGVPPDVVQGLIVYMRDAALDRVALPPSQGPRTIEVVNRGSGGPSIWLSARNPGGAVIYVVTGAAAWSQLAYQFGHEFGHVLANSWQPGSEPALPSQWIEETAAEAFALEALSRIARRWSTRPPIRGNNGYGSALTEYRATLLRQYEEKSAPSDAIEAWVRANPVDPAPMAAGTAKWSPALIVAAQRLFATTPAAMADIAALNLWPERSRLEAGAYLDRWRDACRRLGTPGKLPEVVRSSLAGA